MRIMNRTSAVCLLCAGHQPHECILPPPDRGLCMVVGVGCGTPMVPESVNLFASLCRSDEAEVVTIILGYMDGPCV